MSGRWNTGRNVAAVLSTFKTVHTAQTLILLLIFIIFLFFISILIISFFYGTSDIYLGAPVSYVVSDTWLSYLLYILRRFISNSDHITSNERMTNGELEKDVQGSGRGLIKGTVTRIWFLHVARVRRDIIKPSVFAVRWLRQLVTGF
jgi:hypothetical protein